jgi:hypothetical protein
MDNSAQLKLQLREASEAEIASRIKDHQVSVDRIKAGIKRRGSQGLAPRMPQLDLLAIGDSWFEYPLNDDGLWVPFWNAAVVGATQLQSMGNPPPLINSIAMHGQPMTAIMAVENQKTMRDLLKNNGGWLNEDTGLPDAILVSGGGDDIAGGQFVIYLDALGGGLSPRFQAVLDSVEASYNDLFTFRDEFAPNVRIFGHCYDYALPNGHGTIYGGPWLRPSLDFTGYNCAEDLKIVQAAIDRFYAMLQGLACKAANLFTLVDTRGTLTRNTSRPLGWANELHPYFAGFSAVAERFVVALRNEFQGRI